MNAQPFSVCDPNLCNITIYKLSIPFYFVLKHAVGFFCCPIYIASAHRPRNSFFGGSKLLLSRSRPGSKANLW